MTTQRIAQKALKHRGTLKGERLARQVLRRRAGSKPLQTFLNKEDPESVDVIQDEDGDWYVQSGSFQEYYQKDLLEKILRNFCYSKDKTTSDGEIWTR